MIYKAVSLLMTMSDLQKSLPLLKTYKGQYLENAAYITYEADYNECRS